MTADGGKPPHPFVSCGTPSDDNGGVQAPKHVEERLKAIFREASKGNELNHMMGAPGQEKKHFSGTSEKICIAWQPHNYRLYFDFDKEGFTPEKPSNHALRKMRSMVPEFNTAYTWTSMNWDSEFRYTDFMVCDIRVKKTQVEIIPKSHSKQWRKLEADDPDVIEQRQIEILKRLEFEARKALRVFIDLHGGSTSYQFARDPRIEDGVRGDDFLDALPPDQVIHDQLFKKVYRHKVEFKGLDRGGTLHSQNYIHNRAAEKVTPAILDGQDQIIMELRALPVLIVQEQEIRRRRDDPFTYMFAHKEEFEAAQDGTEWIKEAFRL